MSTPSRLLRTVGDLELVQLIRKVAAGGLIWAIDVEPPNRTEATERIEVALGAAEDPLTLLAHLALTGAFQRLEVFVEEHQVEIDGVAVIKRGAAGWYMDERGEHIYDRKRIAGRIVRRLMVLRLVAPDGEGKPA